MKCAHCKTTGPEITIAHVRACSQQSVHATMTAGEGSAQREWNRVYGPKAHFTGTSERSFVSQRQAERRPLPQAAFDGLAGSPSTNEWAEINRLRKAVAPYLVRKARNSYVGFFAVDNEDVLKFYRVKKITGGRWDGKVFVDVQASDEFHSVRRPDSLAAVLREIIKNPHAAEQRYGQELGQCYRCNRTLTDETSRELGIGPECRKK